MLLNDMPAATEYQSKLIMLIMADLWRSSGWLTLTGKGNASLMQA